MVDAVYFKRLGLEDANHGWFPSKHLRAFSCTPAPNFFEDGLNHHQSTSTTAESATTMNVKGVTTFFLIVFFNDDPRHCRWWLGLDHVEQSQSRKRTHLQFHCRFRIVLSKLIKVCPTVLIWAWYCSQNGCDTAFKLLKIQKDRVSFDTTPERYRGCVQRICSFCAKGVVVATISWISSFPSSSKLLWNWTKSEVNRSPVNLCCLWRWVKSPSNISKYESGMSSGMLGKAVSDFRLASSNMLNAVCKHSDGYTELPIHTRRLTHSTHPSCWCMFSETFLANCKRAFQQKWYVYLPQRLLEYQIQSQSTKVQRQELWTGTWHFYYYHYDCYSSRSLFWIETGV